MDRERGSHSLVTNTYNWHVLVDSSGLMVEEILICNVGNFFRCFWLALVVQAPFRGTLFPTKFKIARWGHELNHLWEKLIRNLSESGAGTYSFLCGSLCEPFELYDRRILRKFQCMVLSSYRGCWISDYLNSVVIVGTWCGVKQYRRRRR